ncbi:MAG: O-linked N-acetylglucosamine transferase, SPINDLY family protein [Crinalium sp.]
MNWKPEAQKFLRENHYDQLANFYEQAIGLEPDEITHYWYLGLAYLLQNQEDAAQSTWLLAIAEGREQEVEQWTEELVQILQAEAIRQEDINNYTTSWLIRQYIREFAPTNLNNLLLLIKLSIALGEFTPQLLSDWQLIENLQQDRQEVDLDLLLQIIKQVIQFTSSESLAFTEACLPYYYENPVILTDNLMLLAVKIAFETFNPKYGANIAELCLKLRPEYSEIFRHLSCFYTNAGEYQKGIETAKRFLKNCITTAWKVQGSYLLLRALFMAGSWLEASPVIQQHKSLVLELIENPPDDLNSIAASYLIPANYYLPAFEDQPEEYHRLQNLLAQLFQNIVQSDAAELVNLPWKNPKEKNRKLKIGYIAHTLKAHSVGWLSRWIFKYYNPELFETHLYLIHQSLEDNGWIGAEVEGIYNFGSEAEEIAAKIKEDKIDILVDLDSITLDVTCKVMALKPAPVQVTWLGWDASGIPAIDYFIADPYVLPENAQNYYSAKIWRLPTTYVAVDGFEVAVPTLRRDELGIPADAVIYFSAQHGHKRHPDTTRMQMQIIKQVPHSYFLIKGRSDQATIKQFFTEIAESEGVEPSRLIFLPRDINEYVHRANLGIADIVLDTYPYNGATTTLETLWMGVPLVTRVGQQFAARNSYTFLMNAGVTEGIAWTDAEYVEWGVKLGLDSSLRQQVAGKLRQSRQTSPLWNAKKFTLELEKAYQQMWAKYIELNQ